MVYRELSSLCHDLGYSARALYTLSNSVAEHYHDVMRPKAKGIPGCWICDEDDCRKGLFAEKLKPRAFNEYIRRFGMEALLDRLEINEKAGIVYHREGTIGDYDDFDDIEELIQFIQTGKR